MLAFCSHRQQVNLILFFKGIDIARDIEVIVVVLNLFQAGKISVFLDVIAIAVGLNDFFDVFFTELVLVFTRLEFAAGVDKQHLIIHFLLFKKQKVDDKVLFIDASREFKAGKNQNQLSEENIEKIVKTYRNGDNVEKYAYLASLKEIQDNDYNLNIPRYVDTFEEEDEIDLLAVRAEREQLKAELAKLETEMAGYLKELGYGS